ncbi:MAG: flagellar biosynthesis protein FlaG [Pyrobaculum sp.]
MRGLSEVSATIFLLVATVALSALVVSTFLNLVYGPSQSAFALETARPLCAARVVAVANEDGRAVLYVYNRGEATCVFDKAYALQAGGVVDVKSIDYAVPPGVVAEIYTDLPFDLGYVYRLTGPRGEVAEGRP